MAGQCNRHAMPETGEAPARRIPRITEAFATLWTLRAPARDAGLQLG